MLFRNVHGGDEGLTYNKPLVYDCEETQTHQTVIMKHI